MPENAARVVVIGGSAGAVEAVQKIVADLPDDLNAAIVIVLHLWPMGESYLAEIVARAGKLPARAASNGVRLEIGSIYTAVPDHHLMLTDGIMQVVRGPAENRHRPSIDVLFRSAARAYGNRVVGVLLTGSDDDGASGVTAIHREGGIVVVQDPKDAPFPEMPRSAMRYIIPDHTVPVAGIGKLIARLIAQPVETRKAAAMGDIEDEGARKDEPASGLDMETLGTPSAFTCPDCGGTLWELRDGELLRFRCRVGHAYSPEAMLEAESDMVERALWAAARTLEESASVNRRIASQAGVLNRDFLKRAEEREQHAAVIRDLLTNGSYRS